MCLCLCFNLCRYFNAIVYDSESTYEEQNRMSSSSNTSAVCVSKITELVKLMSFCIDLDKLCHCVFELCAELDFKNQGEGPLLMRR